MLVAVLRLMFSEIVSQLPPGSCTFETSPVSSWLKKKKKNRNVPSITFVLGKCPGMELLDHMVILFLVFWGTSILFSIVAAPVYIPINSVWGGSPFSTPFPAFVICRFFLMMAIMNGMRYFIVVLICIYLIIREVEHFSMCLLAICVLKSYFNLYDLLWLSDNTHLLNLLRNMWRHRASNATLVTFFFFFFLDATRFLLKVRNSKASS